jgi:OmcA/MtrC family decaheme c-type cytochrome
LKRKGAWVNFSDQYSKKRYSSRWIDFAAAGLLAAALAGCGGSGGGGTSAAAPAGGPAAAAAAAPGVAAPTGTAPVTLANLTADQIAALTPAVTVGGVTIASPPKVTFAVSDGATTNNAIIGLGASTQSATATLPSLTYLRFALAKLVPGTNGSPSKWVNYIVTTVPTYKSATDKTIVDAAPRSPTSDREGTLVDNKNGTYTYTFARDITKSKAIVDAAALTAPNVAADLGDLTYDPSLPHRLAIQLSGAGAPVNAIYDFIPATGKEIAAADLTREVVALANCNECHDKLTLHGSRVETKYCVVCHTDQLKYGSTNVASVAGAFPALTETATVNTTTGITSYSYKPATNIADGEVVGDFPIMIHKIHQGKELVKQNYNFANVAFNNKGFSMLGGGQKMCAKCHDETSKVAVNAANWNTKPSRLACGACHDGIKWSDGTGTTLAGAATGHVGKSQSNDGTCALCHGPADIKIYHRTENVTPHNPTVAAGLTNFTYEIKSAAVNATSNDVSIVFRILASTDGSTPKPVTFLAPAAGMANPLAGFTSSPGFLLAYAADATATDGIAAPLDYNNTGVKQAQPISVSIANLLDTAAAKVADGSLSATADADGYYTATLKGTGTKKFPVGAKLRAVGMNAYFTQISPAASRHAVSVVKAVTGDTARRTVVDKEKCANCHEWFEGHGGSRVKETQICVMCHVPGLASSGRGATQAQIQGYVFSAADKKILKDWGIDPTTFGTGVNDALKYPVVTNDFKDLIHGIHAGRERVTPFKDARNRSGTQTLLDFRRMDFPGVLNNCETCHAAGTYSNVPISALASTYESIDAAYAAGIAASAATAAQANTALSSISGTDKVTSPFAAACISCHDSASAQGHVATNGGMIQVDRSVFKTNVATPGKGEACATCHGTGKAEDIAVVHKK